MRDFVRITKVEAAAIALRIFRTASHPLVSLTGKSGSKDVLTSFPNITQKEQPEFGQDSGEHSSFSFD